MNGGHNKKSVRVEFVMSEAEAELVKERMAELGITNLSAYLRKMAVDGYIPNQKLILHEKAMSLPEWDNSEILEFIDNGHTGTNVELPAVQELLTMVQAGKSNFIIVKDYCAIIGLNQKDLENQGILA